MGDIADMMIDGGPAFPIECAEVEGMSLRDYFAGQALAGLCANANIIYAATTSERIHCSATAVQLADELIAMLAARDKETPHA